MGAWSKLFYGMRLIFVGNSSNQTDFADVKSEKIKRHVTCRPQRALQALWVIGLEREVLIEI